jgi:hypothetical protein
MTNVAMVLIGAVCVAGGVLNIARPQRVADSWQFRKLTIAGWMLPRRAALVWARFLGCILVVAGVWLVFEGWTSYVANI